MPKYGSQNFNLSLQPGDIALLFGIQANAALAASAGGAVRTNGVVTFTTSAAHHAIPGFQFEARGVGSVLGTRFDGHYQILTVPSATTLTAQPLDNNQTGGNTNQANDTGGGGFLILTQAELIQAVVPQASIAIAMPPGRLHMLPAFSYEIFFDGAPGAFSFQMQEANLEGPGGNPNGYVTPATAAYTTTVVNANNYASGDIFQSGGGFLRALLNSLTNNVGIIARVRRIQ